MRTINKDGGLSESMEEFDLYLDLPKRPYFLLGSHMDSTNNNANPAFWKNTFQKLQFLTHRNKTKQNKTITKKIKKDKPTSCG